MMTRTATAVAAAVLILVLGCDRTPTPGSDERATAGLSYSITPAEPLSLLLERGHTRAFTPGGKQVGPDEPSLVLVRTDNYVPEEARRHVTEQFVREINKVVGARNFRTVPVTIDGMPGFETLVDATSTATDRPVKVYCAKVFAGDGTFTVFGFAGGEEADEALKMFRRSARSLVVE